MIPYMFAIRDLEENKLLDVTVSMIMKSEPTAIDKEIIKLVKDFYTKTSMALTDYSLIRFNAAVEDLKGKTDKLLKDNKEIITYWATGECRPPSPIKLQVFASKHDYELDFNMYFSIRD